ncbi:MAG TPA: lysylphosphatidylglycerol synthase domain-containing protein [Polyangia bacterium]|nr:lysylphosphatidylglycerol synthase domain-containing protein [Polyangia bacterium]
MTKQLHALTVDVRGAAGRAPLRFVVRLLLVALALFGLSRLVRPGDLQRGLGMVRDVGWPLLLVLLPTAAAMMLDAAGWRQILAALGFGVRWLRMVELRLSVEAIVLAMPGGSVAGEAAKVALLDRRADVPLPAGAASLALTKLLLTAGDAAYLLFAALVMVAAGVGSESLTLRLALAGAAFTGVAAFVLRHLLRRSQPATRLVRALDRLPSARLRGWIRARGERFGALDVATRRYFAQPAATRARCFAPFLLEWFTEGLETFLILRCLGQSLGLGPTLAFDGVGSLLRAVVVVVPAGLGVQDAAQIILLRQLGVADPIGTGAAFVFTKRTKELFWIIVGLAFLGIRRDLWRRPGGWPARIQADALAAKGRGA